MQENKSEAHYNKMMNTPVRKLIISLSVPTVISMLISNFYNLADTFFIGKLGVAQSGAIGIIFTLMSIFQAFGFMFGHGSGCHISRQLADKNEDESNLFFNTAFATSIAFGLIFSAFGIMFLTPFVRLLGATATIQPYAEKYALYILISAPALMGSLVLNNVLRYEGKAFYAMIGLSAGAILNIIGDPIFIFACDLGIDGAGLSTAISQYISFILLLILFNRNSIMKLNMKFFRFSAVPRIALSGFPSLLRQGLNSISGGILNNVAGNYGDACVSAMSIVSRFQGFVAAFAIGIGQGLQPVAGFTFELKKYDRLKQAFFFTLWSSTLIMFAFAVFTEIFAENIVSLFASSNESAVKDVIETGSLCLRITAVGTVLAPLSICPNMLFQSCGLNFRASLLAMLRSGLYFIPCILLLPALFDLLGLQSAQGVADVLSSLTSIPFFIYFFKKYK